MNKVFLIGNLTRDPELTQTTSGISVCRFAIAVTRRFQNAEGNRETDFINIVVWRQQGENCHKYLKKGSKCCVVGSLQTRTYDAQDGTKRYITEVIGDEVEFLSTKNNSDTSTDDSGNSGKEMAGNKAEVSKLEPIDDDTLPF